MFTYYIVYEKHYSASHCTKSWTIRNTDNDLDTSYGLQNEIKAFEQDGLHKVWILNWKLLDAKKPCDAEPHLKAVESCQRCGARPCDCANLCGGGRTMEKKPIDVMVDRFLGWELPKDFAPDGGISFKREFNEHTEFPMKHEPVGTNLLTADQAKAMLKYVLGID